LAIAAWIYHTYAILREYLKYASSLDVQIVNSPNLEFPAVTVCNQNAIRKSMFDAQPTLTQWTDGTPCKFSINFLYNRQGSKFKVTRRIYHIELHKNINKDSWFLNLYVDS
jgi:hypothetical protein